MGREGRTKLKSEGFRQPLQITENSRYLGSWVLLVSGRERDGVRTRGESPHGEDRSKQVGSVGSGDFKEKRGGEKGKGGNAWQLADGV